MYKVVLSIRNVNGAVVCILDADGKCLQLASALPSAELIQTKLIDHWPTSADEQSIRQDQTFGWYTFTELAAARERYDGILASLNRSFANTVKEVLPTIISQLRFPKL